MNELTQRGIQALKSGDRVTSRMLLEEAVDRDSRDLQAWLWLSGAVDTDQERVHCLRKVLEIDPGNQAAARGLEKVLSKGAPEKPASQPDILPPAPTTPEPPAEPAVQAAPTGLETETQLVPEVIQVSPPVDITPPEKGPPLVQPILPHSQPVKGEEYGQQIFRTRPSIVLGLAFFWIFFFGAMLISWLLPETQTAASGFAGILWLILELIVVYVLIRNFRTRYILTSSCVIMPIQGKKAVIPLNEIYHADVRQTWLQKFIGCGDIWLNGIANESLAHLRMRDVPECKRRLTQIQEIIGQE
jgi:hypothetical protein